MSDEVFSHWIRPDGQSHDHASMLKEAADRFEQLIIEEHEAMARLGEFPQDGSRGQALQYAHSLVEAVRRAVPPCEKS